MVFWIILLFLIPWLLQVRHVCCLEEVISTPGGDARFNCISLRQEIVYVEWLVNGTLLENLNLSNVTTEFLEGRGGVMTLTNLPVEYNMTRITCIRLTGTPTSSAVANYTSLLLLQGLLSSIELLSVTVQDSTISLTWTAPFTLDITGVNPDITYCVGVVNSTSSSTLHSQCGITVTEYEYPIPPDSGCHDHMVTVTPTNPAGNGNSSSTQYSQILTSPPIVVQRQASSSIPNTLAGDMDPNIIFYMSDPVCSAEITLIDTSTSEVIILHGSDLTIMLTNVSFTSEKLRLNRKYRIMVNASNINGSFVSSDDISSHDIVETGIHMNPLRIQTEYLLDSQAAGGLFSFLFIDGNGVIDFTKSTYLCLDKNTSQSYVLPFTQSPELYVVSAYDIEEDGLLYSGEAYPATTSTHVISAPVPLSTSSELEDCEVVSDEQVVCVECSYPPNSTCLGFLVVVQRDSISKARTLLVNSTQPGQALGPVTVEVEEGGVYQVTVFAIRGEMGIVGSAVEYSTHIEILAAEDEEVTSTSVYVTTTTDLAPSTSFTIIGIGLGVGLVVLTVIVVILGGVIMAFVCHRVRSNSETVIEKTGVNPEPLEEEAVQAESVMYEEIGDVKDTFNYTQNVLYGKLSSEMTSELNASEL